jgi:hypothetical protein
MLKVTFGQVKKLYADILAYFGIDPSEGGNDLAMGRGHDLNYRFYLLFAQILRDNRLDKHEDAKKIPAETELSFTATSLYLVIVGLYLTFEGADEEHMLAQEGRAEEFLKNWP